MATITERYRELFTRGENTERVVFFSDAVFAIALTLLVLDIRVPDGPPESLGERILEDWFQFFAYILAFWTIAANWVSHHTIFRFVTAYDATIVRANFVVLFFVGFMPVPTALLAEYGPFAIAAPILFAVSISGLGFAQVFILTHARRSDLLSAELPDDLYRRFRQNLVLPPTFFLGSIAAALISPLAMMISWAGIQLAFFVMNRIRPR